MSETVKLAMEMPAVEAARQLLLIQVGEVQKQSRLVMSQDLEISVAAVHDLRVAIRRTLTILEMFEPWLDPDWYGSFMKGFHKILKPLGDLRDLDVLADRLAAEAGEAGDLLQQLNRERDKMRERLIDQLAGESFSKWLGRRTAQLALAEATIKMAPDAITSRGKVRLFRLRDCLAVMLFRSAGELTVYHGVTIDPATLPEELQKTSDSQSMIAIPDDILHRLRVQAKTFRYTIEAFQSILGSDANKLIVDFKQFQDLLGTWHDDTVALRYLRQARKVTKENAQLAEWQAERQREMEQIQIDFRLKWSELTPQWFYDRLAECLRHGYESN